MKKPEVNKRAFKRATLASISRLIGVCLGAGAGSLLYHIIGNGFSGWLTASILCIISFCLMLYTEYEREKDV
jgi:uncharacterized membrane protein YgaE (UPF0421/DUF939 family)